MRNVKNMSMCSKLFNVHSRGRGQFFGTSHGGNAQVKHKYVLNLIVQPTLVTNIYRKCGSLAELYVVYIVYTRTAYWPLRCYINYISPCACQVFILLVRVLFLV